MDFASLKQRASLSRKPDFGRLIKGLSPAAILLGTTLNILEAASIGLLLFPSQDGRVALSNLQNQSMSLYIMSTVISQLIFTFGGSGFPGAISSMLAEAIPFLRGIALSIQEALGDGHPGTVPTIMVAYALTSILLGSLLFVLAVLKCGRVAGYFPRTVLQGVVGAVGVSLLLLGLGVTLSPPGSHLSIGALFEPNHLPLLLASVAPAMFLSLSIRLAFFTRLSWGMTQSPLYVPLFCLGLAATFWFAVAARGSVDVGTLASQGWLFATAASNPSMFDTYPWNYWALYDFRNVEWNAILAGRNDILLLIVIGALTLFVFAQAAAEAVGQLEWSLNREFFGHAVANLLIGFSGAVPAMIISSSTQFFFRAGGRRTEAAIVACLTLTYFFFSSYVLPYVPTIAASNMIGFIGIELLVEAIWDSSKLLVWSEWAVVTGTTLACNFLGFAPGIGVGLATACFAQFCHHLVDSRPRITKLCERTHNQVMEDEEKDLSPPTLPPIECPVLPSLIKEATVSVTDLDSATIPCSKRAVEFAQPPIVRLTGYVGSGVIPDLQSLLEGMRTHDGEPGGHVILDLRTVTTIETCVAERIKKLALILNPLSPAQSFIFLLPGPDPSTIVADLERVEIALSRHVFSLTDSYMLQLSDDARIQTMAIYADEEAALLLCRFRDWSQSSRIPDLMDQQTVFLNERVRIFLRDVPHPKTRACKGLAQKGYVIRQVLPRKAVACANYPLGATVLVLEGMIVIERRHSTQTASLPRMAFRAAIAATARSAWRSLARRGDRPGTKIKTHGARQYLHPGDVFSPDAYPGSCAYAIGGPCWVLDMTLTSEAIVDLGH